MGKVYCAYANSHAAAFDTERDNDRSDGWPGQSSALHAGASLLTAAILGRPEAPGIRKNLPAQACRPRNMSSMNRALCCKDILFFLFLNGTDFIYPGLAIAVDTKNLALPGDAGD